MSYENDLDNFINDIRTDLNAMISMMFHLFLVDELVWFLDGKEVFRRKNDFFKRPLHMAEIMETWDGLPNPDDLPSTFEVDFGTFKIR